MGKYAQMKNGQWVVWHPKESWQCCDCGLVHRVEYRKTNGKLEIRMFRDNRATGQVRRYLPKPKKR